MAARFEMPIHSADLGVEADNLDPSSSPSRPISASSSRQVVSVVRRRIGVPTGDNLHTNVERVTHGVLSSSEAWHGELRVPLLETNPRWPDRAKGQVAGLTVSY